jgi:predicted metal-binding membrane protein
MHELRDRRSQAAAALRWRPEWPFAVVVALAWAAVIAGLASHGTMIMSSRSPAAAALAGLPAWTLMTAAMMAPIALPAVRHVGLNSIRRRRARAMALFFVAYLAVWTVFGIVVLAGAHVIRHASAFEDPTLLSIALAVAAGWQLTRCKRRAVLRCRQTVPLPPIGLRAELGCVRFALDQGWRCVKSCWAVMAAMAFVGDSALAWMIGLTALILVEELTLVGRRLLRPAAVVFAVGAAALVATAGLSQPTGAQAHRAGHQRARPSLTFLCTPRGAVVARPAFIVLSSSAG